MWVFFPFRDMQPSIPKHEFCPSISCMMVKLMYEVIREELVTATKLAVIG